MAISVKQRKIAILESLSKEDLEKIAQIEHIQVEGPKEDVLNRLSNKLNLQKTKIYAKKLIAQQSFDIFSHELIPKHRVLSEKEREEVLQQYKITTRQLPRIRITDPAVLAINGRAGDVIEISRKSPIAGEIKYYRVVIAPRQ